MANLGHKVANSIGEQSNFRFISNAAKSAEMAEVITSVALEVSKPWLNKVSIACDGRVEG